jgi:DNA-binding MarR family transcriptional regulator
MKHLQVCKFWGKTTISTTEEQERFSRGLSRFRRATLRGSIFTLLHSFDLAEFSLPQVFTLLLLDEQGERPIKEIAAQIGRSVSTTSRLLDQLVERGLISRREDAADRRTKRVAITPSGHELIANIEQQRAVAQITVLDQLAADERAIVIQAIELLAEASARGKH